MGRNVEIIKDTDEKKVVVIHDICFKGKRNLNWDDVKDYLKMYVGEFFDIVDTGDVVYIGSDLPDEYTGSTYTKHLKGMVAKAKANAVQGIPEMLEMVGIGMRQDLHYPYIMKMVRLNDIMFFMQGY